jgi:gluconolactonase
VSRAIAEQAEHLIDVDAHEGPVYVPEEDALYFTSVPVGPGPRVDSKRLALDSLAVSVVSEDAGAANGMTLAPDGRLVVCEQLGGALSLVDRARGTRTLLVDGFNSPNDVVVKSDGTIWFTDPSYGWLQGFRPRPLLRDGGSLSGERVIAEFEPHHPDGLKADSEGRLYASFPGGVRVLDPDGAPVGEIELPGAVNFCFGGPRRDVLFITADTAIHAVHLEAKGA